MRGFVYPLAINGGTLEVTDHYPTIVKNAIKSGLLTQTEERVMRPEYGLNAQEFQSIQNMSDILAEVRSAIAIALEGFSDVSFELRAAINEDGRLDIVVVYQVNEEAPERVEITI